MENTNLKRLAMVAAMALSVLAHRRRHNHFNPPV